MTKDLVTLFNLPSVSRPEAVHDYKCRYWRNGKSHGPCTCGARELSAEIRAALVAAGIRVNESPLQVHERDSLTASGIMCLGKIARNQGAWVCECCGWKVEMKV
jgi:hypothetical protein